VILNPVNKHSIGYFEKSTDSFAENLNRMLLGGFFVLNDSNCFWAFIVNFFNHLIER